MKKRAFKKKSNEFVRRLLNEDLRTLIIQAGFPYHKSPHLYQWLWVFFLLPFLPEEILNELSDKYGKELRGLYQILVKFSPRRLSENAKIPPFLRLQFF
jgi:hypothetical protein